MRIESWIVALVAVLVVATHLQAQPAPAEAGRDDEAPYRVTLNLRGVEAKRGGTLRCAIFTADDGWPTNDARAYARTTSRGEGERHTCTFTVPGPGQYAASVGHDENGNRRVDANVFGAPTEGWGTTRNVTHAFRAPSFEESTFEVTGPATTQVVRMHY